MGWTEISISVAREHSALAEQALEEAGALAITLQDDEDHPVLEPGPGATPLWPSVQVRGLFESGARREPVLTSLQAVLQHASGADRPDRIRWRELEDQDWERAWMDRFEPMKFGERLWVVPGGMSIPSDPQNIEIRLDPGLAFGTGTHPTTALCLEWLDAQHVSGLVVVDYGCGSGVLGIAAALKGAERVICVDNDPQALEATAENAARNGVASRIECQAPDSVGSLRANLVLANILAAPLIGLATRLTGYLLPGGRLALSGILQEQAQEVLDAYESVMVRPLIEHRDEWVLLAGQRPSAGVDRPGADS